MICSAASLTAAGVRAIAAAALVIVSAAPAASQQVRGRILDEGTRQPIILVEVIAVEIDAGVLSDTVRSDSSGYFLMMMPRPGRYIIRARRLGYEPAISTAFSIEPEQAIDLQLLMDLAPSRMARVVILERRHIAVSTVLDGFERRRTMGLGTFFTVEEIRARRPNTVMDLLHQVPGVRVSPAGSGQRVSSSRGNLGVLGRDNCMPIFWVDGVRINRAASEQHVLQWLPRGSELQAVEVYMGRAQYPAEFGGPEAKCGVVVVWTRAPIRADSATSRHAVRDTTSS